MRTDTRCWILDGKCHNIDYPILMAKSVRTLITQTPICGRSEMGSHNRICGPAEANKLLSKSQIHEGDVLTVRTGYPGTSCVVPPEFDGANCVDLLISRPKAEILSEYLNIWINSDLGKAQVLRKQGGLAQQHFNVGELENLLIGKPRTLEQKRMVNMFQAHSASIKAEQKFLNKLQLQKKGLMHDLLTGKVTVKVDTPVENAPS